ncbi:hypothetical protein ACH50O_13540 [Methylomonas sp. 2BW1-5-20]|uniref:hypothetical protein n=1 Tax=Methylomonas sp. 2BW1-5-20 TaxID=3376686 RepID=UPI0040533D6D
MGRLPAITNAIYEAFELIDIYSSLSGKYDRQVSGHLHSIVAGPSSYSDERSSSSSNRARNEGFELAVMGYLAQANIPLQFESSADVTCNFGNRTLLFECKRPQSPGAVDRRIKEAVDQLKKHINNAKKVKRRGLVAVDITKVLNPTFQIFITSTEKSISDSMEARVDQFIAEHEHSWINPRCNQTIGVLIRLCQMNIVEYSGQSKLFHGRQLAIKPFNGAGFLNHNLLSELTQSLATRKSQ